MSRRDRIRVISFRYRKAGAAMIREKECNCDEEQDGTYKVGDIWHYETGNDVWVKVAVEYFPNPISETGNNQVEAVLDRSQRAADMWIQAQYQRLPLK
jgi:hypothetical protein